MPSVAKKKQDARTEQIYAALKKSFPDLPPKENTVYAYNSVSIRVRVIDERFEGKETAERERIVKRNLKGVPKDVTEDITLLLMLTPEESETPSLLFRAFDDPGDTSLL